MQIGTDVGANLDRSVWHLRTCRTPSLTGTGRGDHAKHGGRGCTSNNVSFRSTLPNPLFVSPATSLATRFVVLAEVADAPRISARPALPARGEFRQDRRGGPRAARDGAD